MKKMPTEIVEEYSRRFKKLRKRADSRNVYTTRHMANIFVGGLDAKSKGKVIMMEPTSLEDAIKYAKAAEKAIQMEEGSKSNDEWMAKMVKQGQLEGQREVKRKEVTVEEMDDLTKQMENMKIMMVKANRGETRGWRDDNRILRCNHCGREGHIERGPLNMIISHYFFYVTFVCTLNNTIPKKHKCNRTLLPF
jgi:hypothetical protein